MSDASSSMNVDPPQWVQDIFARFRQAKNDQIRWVSIWRDLAEHLRPINESIGENEYRSSPDMSRYDDLFDTTGVQSNLIYAAGCNAWLSPAEKPWFRYDEPHGYENNENVKKWLNICTQETQRHLANSNFYGQLHECYLDDGAFGTCSLNAPDPIGGELHFKSWGVGDYCALANHRDKVDTIFREYHLTPRQAEQKFGAEMLTQDMRDKLAEGKGDQQDGKELFLHVVMPRSDIRRLSVENTNFQFASYHFHSKTKKMVKESGFFEMPVMTHRHMLWEDSVYGWAPAFFALPECRQLNEMQMNLDLVVELLVNPRLRVPSNLEGEVDLSAGGATFFTDPNRVPEEWATASDYPSGKDRVYDRQAMVRQAFHVDLFQALSSVPPGTEMTATEILARQRDRLTLFSPTFNRKTTELHTPVLQRTFANLLRNGAFPEPPPELILEDANGAYMPDPSITFTSRLALAMEAIHTEGFDRTMARILPMAQALPEIIDLFDVYLASRDIARAEGMDEAWIRTEDDVQRIRGQRAQEIQEAEMREDMLEEAEMAGKLGLGGPQGEPRRPLQAAV